MGMIYILFGLQDLMIKNRIKKILRDDFEGGATKIKISMNDVTIGNLIDEYDQFSITGDSKIIVADDCYFLESSKPKHKLYKKEEFDELVKCLKDGGNYNSIIFIVHSDKIDSKNELVKLTKSIGKIFEFKNVSKNDWPLYVKEYFTKRGVKITDEAVTELVKRVHDDLFVFQNEATKLMLYKGSLIEKNDVIELVSNVLEDDVFSILNNLITGNKQEAMKTYYDLRLQGLEPVTLISLMTSSILYMLNVKNLSNLGMKTDEIATRSGSSTGRVFMTFKNLKLISEAKLNSVVEKLYELDSKIKHSEVDRFMAFEVFLAEF